MKQIKNFKTITKEGFSVANLQRFPSREWGDEGGFQADILYNGQKIVNIYQEGNGGCADARLDRSLTQDQVTEIKEKLISFLKRYDYSYSKDSPYNWLKIKTSKDVGDDEFESLVVNIEDAEENFKLAKKRFKPGVNAVASITYTDKNGVPTHYLQSLFMVPNNDKQRAEHLKQTCEQLNIPQEQTKIHYISNCEFNLI